MDKETEEYLAKIRKTVAESKQMIESVKLRFAETDRLLAESGTSREEVANFRFTPEQRKAVNDELRRHGLPPLEEVPTETGRDAVVATAPRFGAADVQEDMENRRRKFGAMMKRFRM